MVNFITEAEVEQVLLDRFREIGYATVYGPDIAPNGDRPERASYEDVVLIDRLRAALAKINRKLPTEAIEEAIRQVLRAESPSLVQNNRRFHKMLVDGVDVEIQQPGGRIDYEKVWLVDFAHPETGNDFLAVNQFRVVENRTSGRPLDVVAFVNGLPLSVLEIKNPQDAQATVRRAFNQLQTYKSAFPTLFGFNEILVATDFLEARAGTLTADWDRFLPWRTVEGRNVAPAGVPQLDVLVPGMFQPRHLLELIRHFVVFEDDSKTVAKKMAAYHQYHAVNKAVGCTLEAASPRGDRRIGVVWHTQGSGKSLSMVFYAGKIIQARDMQNPTLVVITDRNDLDDQLFGTFAACRELLRQTPQQAESRKHLRELLRVASGGVIFTTIQKFLPEEEEQRHPLLSDRRNIVVIADEAHRSQYDFLDGFARNLRDALPHASFIGFTGTPIENGDRSTPAVFGDYIDVYDIERAIQDRATVPIYYEARMARLDLDEAERPRIDPDFEEVTEAEEAEGKERLKRRWSRLEKLVGTEKRMSRIASDLVEHFERREAALFGKGLIVCMSRSICVDLYDALVKLRPEWHDPDEGKGAIKVVMSGNASEEPRWQAHLRSKAGRERMAKRFKDPDDPLKLVIVRDMWLTGFDVPSLHTMYLDKAMRGHTLMQAIARVNRVFRDKPGGLVVDYLGLSEQLRQAIRSYTGSPGRADATTYLEEILPALRETYEVVRNMMHGFDVAGVLGAPPAGRMAGLAAAMEHVLGLPDGKSRFLQRVSDLSKAFALAGASDEAAQIRDEVAFFQAVRAGLVKAGTPGEGRSREEVNAAIRQIVSRSIVSDEVVDIFAAAGLNKPEISILSDEFLEEVRSLPHRNLTVELLQRLLGDEIRRRERKNVVQARSFEKMLEDAILRYQSRSIETAQLILALIDLAQKMREAQGRGEKFGLTDEELAFYDALAENQSAVEVMGDMALREIARELTGIVRRNANIDWSRRESARANLRRLVRRVLRQRGYPPDQREKATDTVLEQAAKLGEFFVETEATTPPALGRPFRTLPPEEVRPFENAVPVYDLAVAAGRFSAEQQVDGQGEESAHSERFEWAELPPAWRARPGMFVAQVAGESMNRRIPNGAWCLFQLHPQGSREGKIVLVQHREIQDTDTGGHYALKRYHSEKEHGPDGTWRHARIALRPETDREGYEPIVLEPADEDEVQVIAELLGVIG